MNEQQKTRLYLTKQDRITVYENNLVTVTLADGTVLKQLEPRRLFPVHYPDNYITLLDKDGTEAAVIRALSDLDKASLEVIEFSLNDYYLVPHIVKILSKREKYGTVHWCVETDRGYTEFDIRNRNHDIKVYPDGRVRVRDSDDNRYLIPDFQKLDKKSKAILISDT